MFGAYGANKPGSASFFQDTRSMQGVVRHTISSRQDMFMEEAPSLCTRAVGILLAPFMFLAAPEMWVAMFGTDLLDGTWAKNFGNRRGRFMEAKFAVLDVIVSVLQLVSARNFAPSSIDKTFVLAMTGLVMVNAAVSPLTSFASRKKRRTRSWTLFHIAVCAADCGAPPTACGGAALARPIARCESAATMQLVQT